MSRKMEEEVARLRKELAQSRQANTKLSSCSLSVPFAMALIHQYGNAEAALAKKSSRSRKLIPHPKGQAEGKRVQAVLCSFKRISSGTTD
jgi:hypothetical protein